MFMAQHYWVAVKYNVANWPHVISQSMISCSLFDVSKYLDSLPIQVDKTEKLQTHDSCLKYCHLGILQQLY